MVIRCIGLSIIYVSQCNDAISFGISEVVVLTAVRVGVSGRHGWTVATRLISRMSTAALPTRMAPLLGPRRLRRCCAAPYRRTSRPLEAAVLPVAQAAARV